MVAWLTKKIRLSALMVAISSSVAVVQLLAIDKKQLELEVKISKVWMRLMTKASKKRIKENQLKVVDLLNTWVLQPSIKIEKRKRNLLRSNHPDRDQDLLAKLRSVVALRLNRLVQISNMISV